MFDGPINGEKFRADVAQGLAPTLSAGDIGMMDNSPPAGGVRRAPLGSHQRAAVRKAIEAAGAALCFLPIAPTPIEQLFATSPRAFPASCACRNLAPAPLKNALRKMARRTVDAPREAIGLALADFSSEECFNYLRNAGYRST